MKVVTAAEMREIDRITIEEMGMPATVLMGLAGRAVADYAFASVPAGGRIAVFCGTGNNGGDGYAAAYFLASRGFLVELFAAGAGSKISETARVYHDLCVKSRLGIRVVASSAELAAIELDVFDCIIDALLGTGFSGPVKGVLADVIRSINDSDCFVLSVDIPSGLGSDGRAPEGEAVIADLTVTIGLPKLSLATFPGKHFTGELAVADIGFPAPLTGSDTIATELVDGEFFSARNIINIEAEYTARADSHKADRGHLLLVGGFDGMEGAIMMAARAAFETGIGLGSLLTTCEARGVIAGLIPELITLSLPRDIESSAPDPAALKAALASLLGQKRYGAVIVGPGMGRGALARAVCDALFSSSREFGIERMLVDGDGLFHLAGFTQRGGQNLSVETIVTPHFKEASLLSGVSVEDLRDDRHGAAGRLARQLSCTVVLKGPATIVSDGVRFLINTTGSPALAAAGAGDVLSGIIGALLLRRFTPLHAGGFGAWIHGRAADIYCSEHTTDVLKSTDLMDYIRKSKQEAGNQFPERS
jgi:ADP-dependent NAD(P)H-hydrate dehydratase / NAD(P)H-hydrate epimerase